MLTNLIRENIFPDLTVFMSGYDEHISFGEVHLTTSGCCSPMQTYLYNIQLHATYVEYSYTTSQPTMQVE